MKVLFGWLAIAALFSTVLIATPTVQAAPRPCPEISKWFAMSYQTGPSGTFNSITLGGNPKVRTPIKQAWQIDRSEDNGATWIPIATVTGANGRYQGLFVAPFTAGTKYRMYAVTSVSAPCVGATTPREFKPAVIGTANVNVIFL